MQGDLAEAESRVAEAIKEAKKIGTQDRRLAQSLTSLAAIYLRQGKSEEAVPLFKRALEIREKVLGPGHADVGSSLNNLATGYYRLGRYNEAEPLYERSLAIWEKILGSTHSRTVTVRKNLALLRQAKRRLRKP